MTELRERYTGTTAFPPGERCRRVAALSRLVHLIAHDYNNLLAAIISNTDSLNDCLPPVHAAHRYLDNLTCNTAVALDLTARLQAYLEDGIAVFETASLSVLAEQMRADLDALLLPDITLTIYTEPELPPLPLALKLVRQAVRNCMENACEELADSGGTITLTTGRRDGGSVAPQDIFLIENLRPESFLSLEITNSGPAVSPELREHLFDPGFSTGMRSAGLGLCAVMGAMRTHQGCIEVPLQENGFTLRMLFPQKTARRLV